MYCSPFLPAIKTNKMYSSDGSGNNISTTTNFSYDQYKNLTQSQTVNSKGQTEITTISYPAAFVTSASNNPYSLMFNMNNVSAAIEKRVSVAGNLTSAEIHTYQALTANKIYPSSIYNYENSTLVPANSLLTTSY